MQDKLKSDALKRMSSQLLSVDDYRGLFEAHVAALAATARKQYLAALEEEVRPAVLDADGAVRPVGSRGEAARSWEAAAEVLATRPCFQRVPAHERHAMWSAFVQDTAAGACSANLCPGFHPVHACCCRSGLSCVHAVQKRCCVTCITGCVNMSKLMAWLHPVYAAPVDCKTWCVSFFGVLK